MDYENVLLLGGPRDGEWLSVIKGVSSIRMVGLPGGPENYGITADCRPVEFSTFEYLRVPFESRDGTKGAVFTYGDMDPLATLIEGYRKPKQEQPK